MVLFDGVVLALIVGSSLLGLWRGVTREILSLFSWLLAAWGTLYLLPVFHPVALRFVAHPFWALAIAAGIIFLILLISLLFLSDGLVSFVQSSFLKGVDRVCGLLFGGARGVLLVFLLYAAGLFFLPAPQMVSLSQDAISAPWVESHVVALRQDFQERNSLQEGLGYIKEKLAPLFNKEFLESMGALKETPPLIDPLSEISTTQSSS